ncbi:MAG: winged helix-turn-helix domain-containing protein [Terriglobia bacterium]
MMNPSPMTLLFHFGPFELNPAEGKLSRNGTRVKLQDLPFRLLVMLVERPGEIVTRDEVRQELWPENTFVEFDNSLGVAIRKVRDALADNAEAPRYIETIPRRGYRFLAPVQADGPMASSTPAANGAIPASFERSKTVSYGVKAVVASLVISIVFILGWYWRDRTQGRIPERASVVVGDFANLTGEPVFDGSLRRAVTIGLAQSPYLSILPDEKLGELLQDLGRPPDDKLTPALAREVCQRGHAAAHISGAIQKTGGAYLLSMEADRCSDGRSLAQETLSVADQKHVLPRLGLMLEDFRRRLGESRESLQKFNIPIEQATTSSMEALKAYQLGMELRAHSKNVEARPAFKTAIALDPNFAIAYAQLGSSYSNLGNTQEARQYFQKAFELRAHATEPERLYITGRYFDIVTGELEKGAHTYEVWTEEYPNQWLPFNAVANDAFIMGRFATTVHAAREAVRLGPNQNFGYVNLLSGLIALNRLDEAKKICEQLIAQGHNDSFIHLDLFAVASLQQNQQDLSRELDWIQKNNSVDKVYVRAESAGAVGKVRESTKLFEQAAQLDLTDGDPESAANVFSIAAEANSEIGWQSVAQRESKKALSLGINEGVLGLGALVEVRDHNLHRAQELLGELDHDYPISTFNIGIYSPIVRTALAVSTGSSADQITELMEPAHPYEFGSEADMLPIYIRGVSYLDVHSAKEAAKEFQSLLDHHSVDAVTRLYPLSWLGLARSFAMLDRRADGLKAYKQFFALWKDADKDLPVLLSAQREFQALNDRQR